MRILVLALGLSLGLTPALAGETATVSGIDAAHKQIHLIPAGKTEIVAVAPNVDLQTVAVGDRVDVTLGPGAKVDALTVTGIAVGRSRAAVTYVAMFLVIVALAAMVTGGRPREFIVGADRRYSNSKTQIAFWFGAVMAAYFATVVLRVWAGGWGTLGGVDIPANLLVISGLSALSYGGAKAITTQKVDNMVAAGKPSSKTKAATGPSIASDLFLNDLGEADIGDFQMILITAAAIVIFALSAIHYLAVVDIAPTTTLPDVDTTLLSGFGLGQGAYLVKKMASNPGEG